MRLVYLFTLFCKDLLCSCFHLGSRTFICMFNIFVFGHTRPFPVCVVAVAVLFNNISASTSVFSRVEGVGIDIHFIFHYISPFSHSGGSLRCDALLRWADSGTLGWLDMDIPGPTAIQSLASYTDSWFFGDIPFLEPVGTFMGPVCLHGSGYRV